MYLIMRGSGCIIISPLSLWISRIESPHARIPYLYTNTFNEGLKEGAHQEKEHVYILQEIAKGEEKHLPTTITTLSLEHSLMSFRPRTPRKNFKVSFPRNPV